MCLHILLHPYLIRFVLAIFLISIAAPAALSQENNLQKKNMSIAVLEFEPRGDVAKEDAALLSDAFQEQIIKTNEFIVLNRSLIKSTLQEQGFQQSEACSQVACIVEIGKILKVEKIFSGTIEKVGKIYTINIQLTDIATAQINQNKDREYDGTFEDLLTKVIPELAVEMTKVSADKHVQVSKDTTSSPSWLWYLLGGAVVASGVAVYLESNDKNNGAGGAQDAGSLPPDNGCGCH